MYKKEIELRNNEKLIAVDQETAEVREIPTYSKPGNPNVSKFKHGLFVKHHTNAWKLLATQTTKYEYAIATMMSNQIKMVTNSLEPLSDDMTVRELAEMFNISVGKVTSVFQRLFELGVYGKFEVTEENFRHKKYWVFNPFLSCNGSSIDNRTSGLFANTTYAKMK